MKDKINYEQMAEKKEIIKEIIKKKALELRKERQKALGSKVYDVDSCLEFFKSRPNDEEWLDMCIRNGRLGVPTVCKVCRSILGDNLTLCEVVDHDQYLEFMRPKLVLKGDRIEFQEGEDELIVTAGSMERVRRREMKKNEWRKWKAEKMGMASQNPDEAVWHSSSWLNNCCGNCAQCVELYGLEKIPCYEDTLWYMILQSLPYNEEKWECNLEGDCDFCLEKYGAYCGC